jgi:hypothetical protein
MLGIARHSDESHIHMFNELEEGRVWFQMVPCVDLMSPWKENSMVFSYFENLEIFRKKTPYGIFCEISL